MANGLRRIFFFAVTLSLLLSSCTKKQAVKPSEVPEPPAAASEKLILPEPPPPARPDLAEQKQKQPPVTLEENAEDKYIILNFEDTDIKTVIATFAELLDMNYILTPGISGSVTIQSYKKFPVSELFSIFQSILEVNGLTAIREGAFYRILPIDAAKQGPLDIDTGKEVEYKLDSAFITQLVPLQFVKASDIKNHLGSLMPRGTDIIVYEPANMLIVSALPSNLRKFMKLIEALDVSETERETLRTFVYYVENGESKKLADILKSVYAKKTESGTAEAVALQRRVPAVPGSPQAAATLPAEIGEISITAYEDINALIIKASPQTFLTLLEVLKKLDVPVKQVLIEVLIAQVELKGSNEFGFQWLLSHSGGDTTGFITPGLTEPALADRKDFASFTKGQPGGFAYILTENNFAAIIKALAKESKLNVLASPHILTMDNREAKIQIGSREPIFTSVQQGTAGTLVQQQIQYIDVGRLLTVKPHITEKNRVTLDLRLEVSAVGSTGTTGSPSFDTKKAETSAAIQSGHTLILGGIISEERKSSRSGIPFLSRIPLLGYLFSSTTEESDKRELILMVTPHVVGSQDEADAMSKDYQERVKVIREKFGRVSAVEPSDPVAPAPSNPEAAVK